MKHRILIKVPALLLVLAMLLSLCACAVNPQELLEQLLETLAPQERQLIYLRYFADRTQTEVGKVMGISQVQVSRLEKKILENMRKMSR